MSSWRDNLANEIPVELDGELLGAVEQAWGAVDRDYRPEQLSAEGLEQLRERLSTFDSFADPEAACLLDAWRVRGERPPFLLCLVTRAYTSQEGRAVTPVIHHECRMLGLFELGADAGQAVISPESLGETLLELFRKREVDFPESQEFCGRYYVQSDDEAALRAALPKALLDHLGRRRDLFIEVVGRSMLALWSTVVGPEAALEACDFFSRVAARLLPPERGPYR
jgi:hypothetical protein